MPSTNALPDRPQPRTHEVSEGVRRAEQRTSGVGSGVEPGSPAYYARQAARHEEEARTDAAVESAHQRLGALLGDED